MNDGRATSGDVEDTFNMLLKRENDIADVASQIAQHVQEERARAKRFHELSLRDIAVRGVSEWTGMFSEAMQVTSWGDFVALFNKSADRAFYMGATLVIVALIMGLMSLSAR